MFYSHEILTSRKYGVATVWLVATLGAKSGTKKVTRKAILDVDVQKACETIIQPEAPMALRLQSNLLYGVSRVYDQQCSYVLADVQAAQNNIRTLYKIIGSGNIDLNTGKAKPDQLIMLDDPAFDPNMALPALDFNLGNLDLGDTQSSSQSMLSIRGRSGSTSSHGASGIGINLPSSSMHGGSYQLPFDDPFGSVQKPGVGRPGIFDDEAELFQDDMLFEFDANGDMRDIGDEERAARLASVAPRGRLGIDSAASGRVRREHEDGHIEPHFNADDDGNMDYAHDMQMLPDAEPFQMMAGGLGGNDLPKSNIGDSDLVEDEGSSVSAEANQKHRKPRARKALPTDKDIELCNTDLRLWQHNYLSDMDEAKKLKADKSHTSHSKKIGATFVYGSGINGVGNGVGSSKLPSPLLMFSGESLLSMITGQPISAKEAKEGTKRTHEESDEAVGSSPKRSRHSEQDNSHEEEVGRNLQDDFGVMNMDDSIEVGREAPDALAEYHSSAMMPWNMSQSLASHQRGMTSSIAGRLPSIGSRRLASASPLIGRGAPLPSGMDQLDIVDNEPIMYGRGDLNSHDGDDDVLRKGLSHAGGLSSSQVEAANFEMFGPAAQVDTQTAAGSQWVRDILDRESGNFYEYISNTISEKYGDNLAGEIRADRDVDEHVTFEELFNPGQNTQLVAAQAFYHVLSLATKNRVWVTQDLEDEVHQSFGEICLGILA
ncbi:Rec8 like protein-domain-containing protein [Calycina marina]|uniref:Rec8 like protein-domain-containing protein n=1 Tax=Calycina marina TaxID=1763456 RepID=A0A9P7Z9H9_9HELO|nr:Rec8 like protein-domain-containing protein [Calycina marina]